MSPGAAPDAPATPTPAAIAEAAISNGVDLIVMGTHGHGALMHVMMGNAAVQAAEAQRVPAFSPRSGDLNTGNG